MDVNLLIIQFNTALKPVFRTPAKADCFNTIQFNTALKPQTMKFCHYCSRCAIQK